MSFNPVLGLLSGLAQIPQLEAQRQARHTAQDQAQLQMTGMKQQLGQKYLAQQQQMIAGDPKLASDPAFVTKTLAGAKPFGLDVPLKDGPNGEKVIDSAALLPTRDFNQSATMQDRMQVLGLPPGPQRDAALGGYTNVPDEIKSAPQYVPLNAGSVTGLNNDLQKNLHDLNAGGSPSDFISWVKDNYANLKATGHDPDQYLTADFAQHTAGSLAQAKIDQLNSLGIRYKDEDAARAAQTRERIREFGITAGQKQQGLDIKRTQVTAQTQAAQQRIGIAAGNLATRQSELQINESKLDMAAQAQNLATNRFQQQVFANSYTALQRSADSAQREYDGLIKNINTITASNPGYTPDDQTTQRLAELKKTLGDLTPKLQAAQQIVAQQPNKNASQVTGQKVQSWKPPPGAQTGVDRQTGRPVYKVGNHVYSDTGQVLQ